MTAEEARVYDAIPIGQKNAVKLRDLCAELGYPLDGRLLREVFERLIYADHPVCNLRSGYFRPETRRELEAYLAIIRSYKCKFGKKEYRLNKALEHFDTVPMDLPENGLKQRRGNLQKAREHI